VELTHGWSHAQLLEYSLTATLFVALCWLGSRQHLYSRDSSIIIMGTTPQVAALLILPLPLALLSILAAKMLNEAWLRVRGDRPWRVVTVNIGGTVLANLAAGAVYHLLRGDSFIWSSALGGWGSLLAMPSLIALAIAYHVVDALVVVVAICLRRGGEPPWAVFRALFTGVLRYHVALVFLGIVFAVLFKYSHGLSLLIIVPIWFSVQSFKNVHLLRKETVDAVLKLAESIDYRDTGTSEHSQRLTDLTQRLATALGLTLETVNQVILAARVHDLGKIGISNDILLKTGPLTDEERLVMQEHTVIGANILAAYTEFQESVPIVRHHHERWDGRGYPDGLRGEEIPLGSRIITVVDSFDAMTSDRPYRQGMPVATAVERLKDGMGTQFDPRVCATFIEMLIEEGSYSPPESATTYLRLVSERAG
jgi:putative nucleotidyltransferase with HDIG domain